MVFLYLLLVAASAKVDYGDMPMEGRTTSARNYWSKWIEFQKTHDKYYTSHDEHSVRFKIFMDNIDKINRHNAQKLSWTMGVTPFADLTPDEFKNRTACMMNRGDRPRDVQEFNVKDAPDSVDWDAKGMVTPVKNQAQCGSCWAFSTTGAIESRTAISGGGLNSLSEQELVDCSSKDGNMGCNGGLMDYGFKYVIEEKGLCTEKEYPYVAKTERLNCKNSRNNCSERDDPISSYKDVATDNEDALMAAVAEGPVSVAIEADQSAFQLYKGGVMDGRCGKRLDHGVLAVGYGTDNGKKFWKVKNSWGATWGEKGYIRLCRDCGKNGNKGQCGIAGQPSYPVV